MSRGGRVQRYAEEFKQTAIELALSGERPVSQIARELEMSPKTLYHWLRQYRQLHEGSNRQEAESLEEELKRLRRENAQLRQERDLLKKATAYFAKEVH